ncbi:MAG: hypothetical protein JKX69_00150 [Rhodobacteraceae bacterium]|nr:hypothetical protein [Paracoccaceae bacterium]
MDQNTSLKAATLQGAALRELNYTDITQIAEHLPTMFGDASVIRPIVNNTCAPKPAHWPDHELDDDDFNTEWEKWQADPDNYTPPPKPAA